MIIPGSSVWIAANTTWYVFNFRSRLIQELLEAGYEITVLSPADEYVARIRALGVRHIHLQMDNAGTNPFRDATLLLRLIHHFRRGRPRLLLTYTPKLNIFGSLAAAWTNVPVIANISGLGTGFIRGGWLTAVVKLLYRLALRHPRRVFFQNEEDRSQFVRERLVAMHKTARLPGSGVDVRRFTPAIKGDEGKFVFLYCGRLLFDKGIREYVEAARAVRSRSPEVECRALGFIDHGNPTAITQDELKVWDEEGAIWYLGSADDVLPHLAQADCVVLPSYREGCPRSLLEAASMGIPIIATNVPGCRQVVDDGINGFLCYPFDAADLAQKMGQMLALGEVERKKMGLAGRDKMLREFDERIVLDEYCRVITEITRK